MLISKHGDPVVGVDIHFILVPPAGVPVPIPHPHVGMIFDPADYIPFIGSTISINGIPRSQAGTAGKVVPHIPMGGPWGPPPPMSEAEIFMGSATVVADGTPLTFSNLPVLGCQSVGMIAPPRTKKPKKSFGMVLPTSMVTAIPGGMPVMVGSIGAVPTIDMMAMAMKGAFAALGPLAKMAKRAKGGKLADKWKDLATRFNKKVGALMDKKGLSKYRNKVQKKICSVTGHPVNVATGQLFTEAVDLELPGPIPFSFHRVWRSTSKHQGDLGCGWHHSYDYRLFAEEDVAVVQLADGRIAEFQTPTDDQPSYNRMEKLYLKVSKDRFYLEDLKGSFKVFGPPADDLGTRFLMWEADPHGNKIVFHRDEKNALNRIVDSCGRVLHIKTDHQARITELVGPHPTAANEQVRLLKYEYSEAGDLICVKDAHDQPFWYEFEDHLLIKETDRENFNFYFEFDQAWRQTGDHAQAYCIKTWGDSNLFYRDITYDLKSQYTKVIDSKGGITHYYWNDLGVVTKEVNPVGGITKTTFDEFANKLSSIDSLGHETKFEYNELNQLLSVTNPDGHVTSLTYDNHFNVSAITNAKGDVWRFDYDQYHNLTQKILPNGHLTSYSYNIQGLLSSVESHEKNLSLIWERGMLSQVLRDNDVFQDYFYDYLGCNIKVIDFDKLESRFSFDLLGQLISKTNREGNREFYDYNARGQLVAYTDALKRCTRFRYKYIALLTKELPNGRVKLYNYDTELNLISLTNENKDVYRFAYDKHERLIEEIAYDGRHQKYEYNSADAVIRHLDGQHRVTQFKRDWAGQLLEKICSDGEKAQFEYDELGRLRSAENAHSKTQYEYNSLGDILAETQDEITLHHSYNVEGQKIQSNLPNGDVIDYAYTRWGDLSEIRYNDKVVSQSTFDKLGRELTRQVGSAVQVQEYDVMGRLTSFKVQQSHKRVIDRSYNYDAVGNLTQIYDGKHGATHIQYDPLDRVLNTACHTPEKFVFDPAGNLIGEEQTDMQGYTQGNRLRVFEDKHFDYDDVGNLVKESAGKVQCKVKTFVYNHQNQLVAVHTNGQEFVYRYDALGRRISKSDAFGETQFLWDGDLLLSEKRQHKEKLYLYEPDSFRPLCQIEQGNISYYQLDQAGTPREMTNEQGDIVWQVKYKVYGSVVTYETERIENNIRFQGQYYDSETGLHYNRFRYYHPGIGRYLNQDPIGLLGGENLYSYCENPFGWIDPLGLASANNYNPKDLKNARQRGVNRAKSAERDLVQNGHPGTADAGGWSLSERKDIAETGQYPSDVRWHHVNDVKRNPELADVADNVIPSRGSNAGHVQKYHPNGTRAGSSGSMVDRAGLKENHLKGG